MMEHVIISPVLVARMKVHAIGMWMRFWKMVAAFTLMFVAFVEGLEQSMSVVVRESPRVIATVILMSWMNVVFVLVTTLLVQGVPIHQHATTIQVRQFWMQLSVYLGSVVAVWMPQPATTIPRWPLMTGAVHTPLMPSESAVVTVLQT